jgi:chemotaxis protein methyltransferase WspC
MLIAPPPDALEAARALADAGDEWAAADLLDDVAATAHPTSELFCLRGVVSEALGLGDVAEAYYRKALYLDPTHFETLAHLSLLLQMDGRASAANRLRRRVDRISA